MRVMRRSRLITLSLTTLTVLALVVLGWQQRRAARKRGKHVPVGVGQAVPVGVGQAVPLGVGQAAPDDQRLRRGWVLSDDSPQVTSTSHGTAEYKAHGLSPAPEADRRTLLRRVSLDVTGLPPTPEESERFAQDPYPDAYERVVDELLASPRYGERMAVVWLDLVRYADTEGYSVDADRRVSMYRDFVLQAFNQNRRFD